MPNIQVPSQIFTVTAVTHATVTVTPNAGYSLVNLHKGLTGNLRLNANVVPVIVLEVLSPGVLVLGVALFSGQNVAPQILDLAAYDGGTLYFENQLVSSTIETFENAILITPVTDNVQSSEAMQEALSALATHSAVPSGCVLRLPRDIVYPAPQARYFKRYWKDPPDPDPGVRSGIKIIAGDNWTTALNPIVHTRTTSCLLTVTMSAQITVFDGADQFNGMLMRATAQQGSTVQYFPGAGDEFSSFFLRRTTGGDGCQAQASFVSSLEVSPDVDTDIKFQFQSTETDGYVLFLNVAIEY